MAALVGDLAPVEAAFSLKKNVEALGSKVESRVDGAKLPAGNRGAYAGTARIEDIDSAKSILLVGTNPRLEAPVAERPHPQGVVAGGEGVACRPAADLTYDYTHSAPTARAGAGRNGPGVVIVGQGALTGDDGAAVLAAVQRIAEKGGAKVLVLHTAAARVGALDVGCCATEGGIAAALGWGRGDLQPWRRRDRLPKGPVVIYQGSHGDRGAHRADIILPAAAYTEENAVFVNTEGRPQLAMRAGFPPGEAKENWAILRALSAELGAKLPWDSLAGLRNAMVAAHPHLGEIDEVPENAPVLEPEGTLGSGAFVPAVRDFYLTNPIARASALMAELSRLAAERAQPAMAAE